MRLIRWLAVGCSLGKIRDDRNRYKMAEQGLLPRFGPVRKATPEPSQTDVQKRTVAEMVITNERTRERAAGKTAENERNSMTTAAAERTEARASVHGNSETQTSGDILPGSGQAATSAAALQRFPLGRWTSVLRNPFGKTSKTAAPIRTPVQSELLLDLVKPVRNDLSDSDLVVVPGRPPVSAKAPLVSGPVTPVVRPVAVGQPEINPSEPAESAEPTGLAEPVWSRLKTQFFGAEKG